LRVHIAHLREKLEADPSAPALIVTEPAVGYRLLGALK
jgi:two-component system KDP operon response regulator KdpE